MSIKKDYVITKRNALNEIRANNMTLQELRFFSIYLSKINPKDIKTRTVRFLLSDFQKILNLEKIKLEYIKSVTDKLLCKIIHIPLDEFGSYTSFQLFQECSVKLDKSDSFWYVEINAHDKALPLLFEFKDKYFTYKLWNALSLKSSNQLRMYEILKQYEKVGKRTVLVEELKALLGIDKKDYKRFGDFKTDVLEVCRLALSTYTDISFTYEPTGKKGRGGKILNLEFLIYKNKNYIDKILLKDFLEEKEEKNNTNTENSVDNYYVFYLGACDNEFSIEEIKVLYNLAIKILSSPDLDNLVIYDYLKRKYDELLWRAKQTKISKRFNYLKKIIELDLDD